MTTNSARQPKGRPVGGQFAAKSNPEAEVGLEAEQPVRQGGPDGTEAWSRNGQLHRTDGPAYTWPDGMELWYFDGQPHRTDGPAYTYPDGTEEWWEHGHHIR